MPSSDTGTLKQTEYILHDFHSPTNIQYDLKKKKFKSVYSFSQLDT